ncbi:hypothetical protein COW46_04380 [Candidatus Gracilibacteria bacterium CG17_big_fil_post_rev_8_21_14_2_50_48_13]|nr:MAG: hypothetical protein COW46_04380 [Candidatus Gracilibacteria bacterium CG17_big_fil_post_rev_8_21_14_2_50_48_13]
MDAFFVSYVLASGILGLAIGSFLAARVARTVAARPQNLWGRSHCFTCNSVLGPLDMIPLVSYTISRGKCRHCHTPYSSMYSWIELTTMLLFLLLSFVLFQRWGTNVGLHWISITSILLTGSLLLYTAFVDIKLRAFPVHPLLACTLLNLGIAVFGLPHTFLDALLASLMFAGSLAMVRFVGRWVAKQEVMGSGDVWLALLLGSSLGVTGSIVAFYGAFLSGAILGIGILYKAHRAQRRPNPLPFAPFLVFGWIIALLAGDPIFHLLFPL